MDNEKLNDIKLLMYGKGFLFVDELQEYTLGMVKSTISYDMPPEEAIQMLKMIMTAFEEITDQKIIIPRNF